MQHIQEILNAKRLNKEKILASPVSISIKYDGTALQYSKGNFYKRPYKPSQVLENKIVTKFDLALNDYYSEPIDYLKSVDIENVCKKYDVVNFEIFSKTQSHTVKYSNDSFKNGIIILSAYIDGEEIEYKELKVIAQQLGISCVEQIVVNQTLESIGISYNMLIDNKEDIQAIFNIFLNRLSNIKAIDSENLEGFVITLYDEDANTVRKYKVINPAFTLSFMNNRSQDQEEHSKMRFENLCCAFNQLFDITPISWIDAIKNISDDFEKRLLVFSSFINNKNIRKMLADAYKKDIQENGSSFNGNTLNKKWLKENYIKYTSFLNYIRIQENSDIAFLFLIIYKRPHTNNVFNVDTETNERINFHIERIFS